MKKHELVNLCNELCLHIITTSVNVSGFKVEGEMAHEILNKANYASIEYGELLAYRAVLDGMIERIMNKIIG